MIHLFKVFNIPGIGMELEKVLQSGYIGQGKKVEEFESQLRTHFQNEYINTLNSASSGITLAVRLSQAKYKNEVISTPLTCTATNWSILANDNKIKWADINRHDLNINVDSVINLLSPRTLAIVVVHWAGYACDLMQLKKAQDTCEMLYGHRPPIIEDCAHCWDSYYENRMVGTHGNICIFSFGPIKSLTTGDGGILISPNEEVHKRAKLLRWYGLDRTSDLDFRCNQNIQEWGYKFHMNDIDATIGINNLPHVSNNVLINKKNGAYYNEHLKNIPGLTLVQQEENRDPSYWIYSVLVEDRKGFSKKMEEAGIETSMVHERNDQHQCVIDYATHLPNMDFVSPKLTNIPCGWWVGDEDRERIVETIRSGW